MQELGTCFRSAQQIHLDFQQLQVGQRTARPHPRTDLHDRLRRTRDRSTGFGAWCQRTWRCSAVAYSPRPSWPARPPISAAFGDARPVRAILRPASACLVRQHAMRAAQRVAATARPHQALARQPPQLATLVRRDLTSCAKLTLSNLLVSNQSLSGDPVPRTSKGKMNPFR